MPSLVAQHAAEHAVDPLAAKRRQTAPRAQGHVHWPAGGMPLPDPMRHVRAPTFDDLATGIRAPSAAPRRAAPASDRRRTGTQPHASRSRERPRSVCATNDAIAASSSCATSSPGLLTPAFRRRQCQFPPLMEATIRSRMRSSTLVRQEIQRICGIERSDADPRASERDGGRGRGGGRVREGAARRADAEGRRGG